jgi:hypothetical protein
MTREEIEHELTALEAEYGFSLGYNLMYSPWGTQEFAQAAFISLNPGRSPDDQDRHIVSDERGNSYEVERLTTRSPLTAQFLKLSELLGIPPKSILTGTAHPFRSYTWSDLTPQQKSVGLNFGRKFWSQVLGSRIKLVITLGDLTTQLIGKDFDLRLTEEIASGWAATKLKRYSTSRGFDIVQLPHLSHFKLLSRKECEGPLAAIFRLGFPY